MNTKDKLRDFVEQLKQDSKGSRWGIHGYSCVDDDYFKALDYVIERLDNMLKDGYDLKDRPIAKYKFRDIIAYVFNSKE